MITALIVGDDLLVRLGIAGSVPWAELNVALVGEAEDSQEAWKLYLEYHPDILVAYINKPGLNGMELIRKIRDAGRDCAVILVTNANEDSVLEEAGKLGVSEILSKKDMKRDDISAAVRKVCASFQGRGGDLPAGSQKENVSRYGILKNDYTDLPFIVWGMTGFRLLPDDHLSPMLQRSLYELFIQRLGDRESYVLMPQETCQLLLWKESPQNQISEEKLLAFARDVQDTVHVELGIVTVFDELSGADVTRLAHLFVSLLHDPGLFDHPVLRLDKQGSYYNKCLDTLHQEFMINLPLYADNEELMKLRAMLERYPGSLVKGSLRIMDNAGPLLMELGIAFPWRGIWDMTEQICSKAGERLTGVIGKVRPEIRKVMEYIQTHLADNLSLNQISRFVGFESAYFSKVFKTEVHMNYSDYLYQVRMRRAGELLIETNDPISAVAAKCGFPNFPYFSTRFRQYSGMTPSKWREQKKRNVIAEY